MSSPIEKPEHPRALLTGMAESAGAQFASICSPDTLEPNTGAVASFLFATNTQQLVAISLDGNVSTHEVADINQATTWATDQNNNRRNVYWAPNILRPGLTTKASKADVCGVSWLTVDIDPTKGETKAQVWARVQDRQTTPPTLVVDSGGGFQLFWKIPDIATPTPLDQQEYETYNRGLVQQFQGDPLCWNVDRIMRLPGTINWPDARKRAKGRIPTLARIVDQNTTTHDPNGFTAVAPKTPTATIAQTNFTIREITTLELQALVPDAKLRQRIAETHGEAVDGSAEIYGVCAELRKLDLDPDTIASIVSNENWGVSAHLSNQTDPTRALWRAVGHGSAAGLQALEDSSWFVGAPGDAIEALGDFGTLVLQAETALEKYLGTSAQAVDINERQFTNNAAAMLDVPQPKTNWLIRGLLARNKFAVVAAEPKAGKTWCQLEMCLAVANGWKAFGEFQVIGNGERVCIFLAEDDLRETLNSLKAFCKVRDIDPKIALRNIQLETMGRLDLSNVRQVARVIAAAHEHAPALIVLDPLREIHLANENDSTEMARVWKTLQAIRDLCKCSVMITHHNSKSNADSSKRRAPQRMRGSGGLHGAMQAGFYIGVPELTQTDETCTWDLEVFVELRGARGAGTFSLRLEVKDDENGECTHAQWTVGAAKVPGDDKQIGADSDMIKQALFVLGGSASLSKIRTRCGVQFKRVPQILENLKVQNHVSLDTSGSHAVWRLNDAIVKQMRAEMKQGEEK